MIMANCTMILDELKKEEGRSLARIDGSIDYKMLDMAGARIPSVSDVPVSLVDQLAHEGRISLDSTGKYKPA